MAKASRKQVVGYVPSDLKDDLLEMRNASQRLTESALVEEALRIAMPKLRERHLSLTKPTMLSLTGKKRSRE